MAYKHEEMARKRRVNLYFSQAEYRRLAEMADLYGAQKAALMRERLLSVADQEVSWARQFGPEKAARMRERLIKLAEEEIQRADLCERLIGIAKKEIAAEAETEPA